MIVRVYGRLDATGIEGVLKGATIAAAEAGCKITKSGVGKEATYTFSR